MSRSFNKNGYTKSKRFDKSCRCNGGCSYCYENRMYQHKKLPTLNQELEFMEETQFDKPSCREVKYNLLLSMKDLIEEYIDIDIEDQEDIRTNNLLRNQLNKIETLIERIQDNGKT